MGNSQASLRFPSIISPESLTPFAWNWIACNRPGAGRTVPLKVLGNVMNRCAASSFMLSGIKRLGRGLSTGDERGAALIEFAATLPVLLLVVTTTFTFGVAFNNFLMVTEGVSVGARLLAISRGQTTDPCALTATAIYNAAPSLTHSKFLFTFVLNGTTYNGASCSSSSTSTGAAGNLVQGQSVQVTASYPCTLGVYGANLAPSCTLKAQTTELVQ
jgi:Flp pilus assembly protein TadG